jgi:hypothetical protein
MFSRVEKFLIVKLLGMCLLLYYLLLMGWSVCFRKQSKAANSRNDRRWAIETVRERGSVKIVSENVWRRENGTEIGIALGVQVTEVGIVTGTDHTGAAGAPAEVAVRRGHDHVANHTVPGISCCLLLFGFSIDIYSFCSIQTGSGALPASYSMGTRVFPC